MEPAIPEPAEQPPEVEAVQEVAAPPPEEPGQDPQAKKRGRPPGAKNKPKIKVAPLEPPLAEQPATEEPAVVVEEQPSNAKPRPKKEQAPRTKLVVVPQAPPATPHDTFRMALAAMSQLAQADRVSRQAHFDALVSRMVR